MESLKDPFIQFLMMIVPLYLCERVLPERVITFQQIRIVIAAVASLSILVCMSFPIHSHGLIYDLRYVPLIVGTLYGGLFVGVIEVAVITLYRLFLGVQGFGIVLVVNLVILMFTLACRKDYLTSRLSRKSLIATLLGLCTGLLVMIGSYLGVYGMTETIDLTYFAFLLQFMVINILILLLVVYLLESTVERYRLRRHIQQSEKLQVLSHLAASVAHEVRNPLTVVRGFVQLLSQTKLPDEKKEAFHDLILQELDRAQVIINDYLSFAKPQDEKQIPLDVKEQLRYVSNVVSSYALMQGVEIQEELEDGLYVTGDPDKFTQVFINLCKNAVEAMPDGGVLTIRAERVGQEVVMEVEDTGIGMPEEVRMRIGQPFNSTKERGTGLGLMVCNRIVQGMGGVMEVESVEGRGTRFVVRV
ncbi:ATP-binding protein [Brevibacillus dissolubilis]|uniref:ATP-binding protein n=1 Tax=Brevibacillus dissolubilis TaxID=1844116 RepID=UPI001116579E|nr:ATP-binding protein [Brevibacillus dissolubilis]